MANRQHAGLLDPRDAARSAHLLHAPNGVAYANVGETELTDTDLGGIVGAVPAAVAQALATKVYYFVPLALAGEAADQPVPPPASRPEEETTLISPVYTPELGEEAICHRNVGLAPCAERGGHDGVFISARLLRDRFALAFELFINVSHAYVEAAGVPERFRELLWAQATAGTRGETSQDAQESRAAALADPKAPDEKARAEYFSDAFADSLAIYQLSLAVDFDYSELREREYPLLAPAALAARLKLAAELFPPNAGYEFAIRYRRR